MGATTLLLEQLERHYIKPGDQFAGGIFVPECGINGATGSRVDALYVGFTSTSGRLLVGHELKVTRSDWLRELEKTGKADTWADQCHEWWIVAPGPTVVPVDEVPNRWGLMYPPKTSSGRRFQIVRRAAAHPERTPSWETTRSIMARLDTLQASQMSAHRRRVAEEEYSKAQKLAREQAERRGKHQLTPEQQERLQTLERIEQLLGEPIENTWGAAADALTPEALVATLRLVRSGRAMLEPQHQRYVVEAIRRSAQAALDGLEAFDEARAALVELTEVPR